MAEEQRCGEGHRLCANNCGFFGSPATLNLCSKCYRDYCLKEDQASSAIIIAVEKSLMASSSPSSPSSSSSSSSSSSTIAADVSIPVDLMPPPAAAAAVAEEEEERMKSATAASPPSNRCASCRKRVGLTGFKCRCGSTFCGTHRYAEQHACTFDFKEAGRDAIARANPLIKADKLRRKI